MSAIFEWLGVATGIAGAYLLGSRKAENSSYRLAGFSFFLFSNFGWIIYGLMVGMKSIVVLQIVFTMTSIRGIINNWPR